MYGSPVERISAAQRILSIALVAAMITIGIAVSRHRPALDPSGPLIALQDDTAPKTEIAR